MAPRGALAQLVERRLCKRGVRGSSPLCSTPLASPANVSSWRSRTTTPTRSSMSSHRTVSSSRSVSDDDDGGTVVLFEADPESFVRAHPELGIEESYGSSWPPATLELWCGSTGTATRCRSTSRPSTCWRGRRRRPRPADRLNTMADPRDHAVGGGRGAGRRAGAERPRSTTTSTDRGRPGLSRRGRCRRPRPGRWPGSSLPVPPGERPGEPAGRWPRGASSHLEPTGGDRWCWPAGTGHRPGPSAVRRERPGRPSTLGVVVAGSVQVRISSAAPGTPSSWRGSPQR